MMFNFTGFHEKIAQDVHGKQNGLIYCHVCKKQKNVNYAGCYKNGWPTCCGKTMSLDKETP